MLVCNINIYLFRRHFVLDLIVTGTLPFVFLLYRTWVPNTASHSDNECYYYRCFVSCHVIFSEVGKARMTNVIYSRKVCGQVGWGWPRRIFVDQIRNFLTKGKVRRTRSRRVSMKRVLNYEERGEVDLNLKYESLCVFKIGNLTLSLFQ